MSQNSRRPIASPPGERCKLMSCCCGQRLIMTPSDYEGDPPHCRGQFGDGTCIDNSALENPPVIGVRNRVIRFAKPTSP